MRPLLDSTYVMDVLEGVSEAIVRQRAIFETGDEAFVNEVVVCEVRAGMRRDHEHDLRGILEPVESIQPGPETAIVAGTWRRTAHERGYSLSLPDALIASAAEAIDAAVVTRNVKDFALAPVRVETY